MIDAIGEDCNFHLSPFLRGYAAERATSLLIVLWSQFEQRDRALRHVLIEFLLMAR